VRTSSLLANSQNVDLLISEAMNKQLVQVMESVMKETGNTANAKLLFDIQDYHMDVSEVGALAQEAHVQRLALNHLAPRPRGRMQANRFFRDPVKELYSGEIFVGKDGLQIVLPVP
jgi:ribonuclease Z